MEISASNSDLNHSFNFASMRPWPFDHGNFAPSSMRSMRTMASMRPWPFDHGNFLFDAGFNLRRICFNEAMTFRSWKSLESGFTYRITSDASMRPWPFDHGNEHPTFGTSEHHASLQWGHDLSIMEMYGNASVDCFSRSCFNEAMTFRSWKWRAAIASTYHLSRFNEAMTFRSWKYIPRQSTSLN